MGDEAGVSETIPAQRLGVHDAEEDIEDILVTRTTDDESEDALTEINDANGDDPVDELFDPNLPNPVVFPLPGDRITFLDTVLQPPAIINAQVTEMKKTVKKRWPNWYNILREGSLTQTSVDLVTSRWIEKSSNKNPANIYFYISKITYSLIKDFSYKQVAIKFQV